MMMCRWIVVCALVSLPALLEAQETVVESAVDDPEKLRIDRRSGLEADHDQSPSLPSTKIDQVIDFDLDQEMIVLRTALPQVDVTSRIDIPSLPGFTTVRVQGQGEAATLRTPRSFELTHYNFATPGAIAVQTQVLSTIGHLMISRTFEGITQDWMVQFIQTQQPFGLDIMGNDKSVKLYVMVTQSLTGAKVTDLNLTAPTIVELRRMYPQQTSEWLGPIFRDLAQDAAIFAADTRAAWQIFAPSIKPEAKLMETIGQIIAQFDADEFEPREAAQVKLEALGQPAAVALAHFDRSELSDEQNSRIDTFLAPYRPLSDEEADRLRRSPGFMLDCLLTEDAEVRKMGLEGLNRLLEKEIAIDLTASAAERSEAVARLRAETVASTQPGS